MTDEMEARRRLHAQDRRLWRLRAYYAILNEQAEFRPEVARLVHLG